MATKPYHHGSLRETLLDCAERVIAERGVASLSLRELARVAGVSPTAPHAHFATRRMLLDAVAERGFRRMTQALTVARAASAEFMGQVEAVSRAYIDFAMRNAPLTELMYSTSHGDPDEAVRRAESAAYETFTELLAEGQRSGVFIPGSADEVGLPFFAAIHGIAMLLAAGSLKGTGVEAQIAAVVTIAIRGISVR